MRRFVSELLTSSGYIVHEASNSEVAFRILEDRDAVDLLIADYTMPGINGLEIIRQARRQRRISIVVGGYRAIDRAT